jgi:hypothetical protein
VGDVSDRCAHDARFKVCLGDLGQEFPHVRQVGEGRVEPKTAWPNPSVPEATPGTGS